MLSREGVELGYRRMCRLLGRKGRDEQSDEWWNALAHRMTDEQFHAAIEGCVENESTFPTVAKLIEYGKSDPSRGQYRGKVPHLFERELIEVVEDVHDRRVNDPVRYVPGFWRDTATELTYLSAVEAERMEKGMPTDRWFPFLRAVAARAEGKLHPDKPAGDMVPAAEGLNEAPE